jgi:hypothetical protein
VHVHIYCTFSLPYIQLCISDNFPLCCAVCCRHLAAMLRKRKYSLLISLPDYRVPIWYCFPEEERKISGWDFVFFPLSATIYVNFFYFSLFPFYISSKKKKKLAAMQLCVCQRHYSFWNLCFVCGVTKTKALSVNNNVSHI